GSGPVRWAAGLALAHSKSDRALEVVLSALDDDAPLTALQRSVHPETTARVRAALAATGVTVFEGRPRPTLAEWAVLSDDERRELAAKRRGPPSRELQRASAAIGVLGGRQDGASVELIVRLFETHPDDRLRTACAHALAALRDPRAAVALDRCWADLDSTISTIAVRSAVMRDPATAHARLSPHLEPVLAGRGASVDDEIVGTLFYVLHGGAWPREVAPDPLVAEPRFVDAAARLRRHRQLGPWARHVLEAVPREHAASAIDRHPVIA